MVADRKQSKQRSTNETECVACEPHTSFCGDMNCEEISGVNVAAIVIERETTRQTFERRQ